jgi:hypothetical protein
MQPVVDDITSPLYNLEKKANGLVDFFKFVTRFYQGEHMMYTYGGDFNFGNAAVDFSNMDSLIEFIN